eukprot:g2177.t1
MNESLPKISSATSDDLAVEDSDGEANGFSESIKPLQHGISKRIARQSMLLNRQEKTAADLKQAEKMRKIKNIQDRRRKEIKRESDKIQYKSFVTSDSNVIANVKFATSEEVQKHKSTGKMVSKTSNPFENADEQKFEFDYQAVYAKLGSHVKARKAAKEAKEKYLQSLKNESQAKRDSLQKRKDARQMKRRWISQGLPETKSVIKSKSEGTLVSAEVNGDKLKAIVTSEGEKGDKARWNRAVRDAIHESFTSGAFVVMNRGLREIPKMIYNTLVCQLNPIHTIRLTSNNLDGTSIDVQLLLTMEDLISFDVSQNQIRCLPENFGTLTHIQSLNLQYNKVTKLPTSFACLKNLKHLFLSGNSLLELPKDFGELHSLEHLEVDNNKIEFLPGTFHQLGNLRDLNISRNRILALIILSAVRIEEEGDAKDWEEFKDKDGSVVYFNKKTGKSRRRVSVLSEKSKEEKQRSSMTVDGWLSPSSSMNPNHNIDDNMSSSSRLKNRRLSLDLSIVSSASSLDKKLIKGKQEAAYRKQLAINGETEWELRIDPKTGHLSFYNKVRQKVETTCPRELDKFGRLRVLRRLVVNLNGLNELPVSLGRLQFLEVLEANFNSLQELPESIGQLRMLTHLGLCNNQIQKLPESIGKLDKLKVLKLDSNRIKTLPLSISGWKSMEVCWLSNNYLVELPTAFGFLEKMKDIRLSNNPLEFPKQSVVKKGVEAILWECRKQHDYDVRGLPPSVTIVKTGIQGECLVPDKRYKMLIDEKVREAEKTKRLLLHWHNLETLPEKLYKLVDIEEIRMTGQLLKSVPIEFQNFEKLRIMKLSGNQIQSIPEEIFRHTPLLEELSLQENEIRALPLSITYLRKLRCLRLSNNKLKALPKHIGRLTNMSQLIVNDNMIEDLPQSFCAMKKIELLILTHNRLRTLPGEINHLGNLTRLHASKNRIEILPDSMGLLENLQELHLANNCLSTLPVSFGADMLEDDDKEDGDNALIDDDGVSDEIHNDLEPTIEETGKDEESEYEEEDEDNDDENKGRAKPSWGLTMRNKMGSIFSKAKRTVEKNVAIVHDKAAEYLDEEEMKKLANTMEDLHVRKTEIRNQLFDTFDDEKNNRRRRESSKIIFQEQKRRATRVKQSRIVDNRAKALQDLIESHMENVHAKMLNKPSKLAQSLRVLWLDCNALQELPESFQNFKNLNVVHIENNPMKSPPAEITIRGPNALAKYCALRVGRIQAAVSKMKKAGLGIDRNKLTPTAQRFLSPKSSQYLEPEDIQNFEEAIDFYVNGKFYECSLELDAVVQDFVMLQQMRRRAFYYRVIFGLVDALHTIMKEEYLSNAKLISGVPRNWDQEGGELKCFAFNLEDLYEKQSRRGGDISSDSEDDSDQENAEDPESTGEEMRPTAEEMRPTAEGDGENEQKNEEGDENNSESKETTTKKNAKLKKKAGVVNQSGLSVLDVLNTQKKLGYVKVGFEYTKSDVLDALENFEGPYGNVAFKEKVDFPECGCLDARGRPLKSRNKHNPCTRSAWVLQEIVYTDEEADRRDTEENEIEEDVEDAEMNLHEYLTTPEGKKELKMEIKIQRKKLKVKNIDLKAEMKGKTKIRRNLLKEKSTIMKRKKAFDNEEDFQLHRYSSATDARRDVEKIQSRIADNDEIIQKLLKKIRANNNVLTQSKRVKEEHATQQMMKRVRRAARRKVIKAGREHAKKEKLRRQWDNGYERWRISAKDSDEESSDSAVEDGDESDDDDDDDDDENDNGLKE